MEYKDDKGNTLYGFSQENLEQTNQAIRETNKLLQVLLVLILISLLLGIGFMSWLKMNSIIDLLIG
ncbi:hypothetical protein HOM13_01705 [Candidatus Woesearchaeota archaeon]|jgi:hypothetical protein|nr:hypothetical protein [Candidatus Woesearchaeota archaeon]MBT5215431.1 hypothetical protein [Candidatus Woesearchaeota archaeon]MBT6402038.1 hypothetical protein [Candidatus Woesearchaeota archaeon]